MEVARSSLATIAILCHFHTRNVQCASNYMITGTTHGSDRGCPWYPYPPMALIHPLSASWKDVPARYAHQTR